MVIRVPVLQPSRGGCCLQGGFKPAARRCACDGSCFLGKCDLPSYLGTVLPRKRFAASLSRSLCAEALGTAVAVMVSHWFCQVLGQELGPMTSHQLMEMARNHNLLPTDLVRRNDSPWVKAKTIKGLFEPGSSVHGKPHTKPALAGVGASTATPESNDDSVLEETEDLSDSTNLEDGPTQIVSGLNPGVMLGNYMILEKLGEGGMGIVLKAQHRRMDRIVAL